MTSFDALQQLGTGHDVAHLLLEQLLPDAHRARTHERAEETVLYAPLREWDEARDKVMEGYEEHHAADLVMRELRKNKAGSEQWRAKAMVLMEMVQHHVLEEEGKLFEKAKMLIDGERAKAMVKEFEDEKKGEMKKAA